MKNHNGFCCLLLLTSMLNCAPGFGAHEDRDFLKNSIADLSNVGSLRTTLDISDDILIKDGLPEEDGYVINFNNISIVEVIRFISKISGINFVFEEETLDFNVTIVSEGPTSLDDIMAALLQELRIHEFSLLQQENTIIIHQNPTMASPPALSELAKSAPITTRLFPLKNIPVDIAEKLVQPYLSDVALINVLSDTGHLLITDIASNVDRVAELIYMLDNKSSQLEVGYYAVSSLNIDMLIGLAQQIIEPISGTSVFKLIAQKVDNRVYVVAPSHIMEKAMVILTALDTGQSIEDSRKSVTRKNAAVTSYKESLASSSSAESAVDGSVEEDIGVNPEAEEVRNNLLVEQLEANLRRAKQEKDLVALQKRQDIIDENSRDLEDKISEVLKKISSVNIEDEKESIDAIVETLRSLQADLEERANDFWDDLEAKSKSIKAEIESQRGVDRAPAEKTLKDFLDNLQMSQKQMKAQQKQLEGLIDQVDQDLKSSREDKLKQHSEQVEYVDALKSRQDLLQGLIDEFKKERGGDDFGKENEELVKQLALLRKDLDGLKGPKADERSDVINRIEKVLIEDRAQREDERKLSEEESDKLMKNMRGDIQEILKSDRSERVKDIQSEINLVLAEFKDLKESSQRAEKIAQSERSEKLDVLDKLENDLKVLQVEKGQKSNFEDKEKELLEEFMSLIRSELLERDSLNANDIIKSIEKLEDNMQQVQVVDTPEDLKDAINRVENILGGLGASLSANTFKLSDSDSERLSGIETTAYKLNLLLKEESSQQRQQLSDNFSNITSGFQGVQDKLEEDISGVAKLLEKVEGKIKESDPDSISRSQKKSLEKIVDILKQDLLRVNSEQIAAGQQILQDLIENVKAEFMEESSLRGDMIQQLSKQLENPNLGVGQSKDISKQLNILRNKEDSFEKLSKQLDLMGEETGAIVKAEGKGVVENLEKIIADRAKKGPIDEDLSLSDAIDNLKEFLSKQSAQNNNQGDLRQEVVPSIVGELEQPALSVKMSSEFSDQLRKLIQEENVRSLSHESEDMLQIIQDKMAQNPAEFSRELIEGRENKDSSWLDRLLAFKDRLKGSADKDKEEALASEKLMEEMELLFDKNLSRRSTQMQDIQKDVVVIKESLVSDKNLLSQRQKEAVADTVLMKQKLLDLESQLVDLKSTIINVEVVPPEEELPALISALKDSLLEMQNNSTSSKKAVSQAEAALKSVKGASSQKDLSEGERKILLDSIGKMISDSKDSLAKKQKELATREEDVSQAESLLRSAEKGTLSKEDLAEERKVLVNTLKKIMSEKKELANREEDVSQAESLMESAEKGTLSKEDLAEERKVLVNALKKIMAEQKDSLSEKPKEQSDREEVVSQAESLVSSAEGGNVEKEVLDKERKVLVESLKGMMQDLMGDVEKQQDAYQEKLEDSIDVERVQMVSSLKEALEGALSSEDKQDKLAQLQKLEWTKEDLKEKADKSLLQKKLSVDSKRKRLLERTMRSRMERKSMLDMFPSLDLPEIGSGAVKETSDFIVYKLEHQDGAEIVGSLTSIADALGAGSMAGLSNALENIRFLPSTNSILAAGPPEVLSRIKSLVANLDVPINQVFIEMLVIDTSVSDSLNFGVQWGIHTRNDSIGLDTGGGFYSGTGLGTTIETHNENSGVLSPTDTPFAADGFTMGIIGRVLTHNGDIFTSMGALVEALTVDINTNIVLNPQIVTEEGSSAELFVGQSLRQLKNSITQPGGGGNTEQTYESVDIGTSLKVTPRLGNKVNIVTLDIEQSMEERTDSDDGDDIRMGPESNSSRTKTKVHIPDGNFLILSGMIREKDVSQETRIPIISRLPLVGGLFKRTSNTKDKRNLMIFIRPHILRDEEDVTAVTEERRRIHSDTVEFDENKFELEGIIRHLNLNG